MKKSKALLDALTPEQQEQVFAYCEPSNVTLADGIKWIANTFGLKNPKTGGPISDAALSAWLKKRRQDIDFKTHMEDIREAVARASLLSNKAGDTDPVLEASVALINKELFEALLLNDERMRDKSIARLTRVLGAICRQRRTNAAVMMSGIALEKAMLAAPPKKPMKENAATATPASNDHPATPKKISDLIREGFSQPPE